MKRFAQYIAEGEVTFDALFGEIESLYYTYQIHNTILKKPKRTFRIWLYADTAYKLVPQIEKLVRTQYATVVDFSSSDFRINYRDLIKALPNDMFGAIDLVINPESLPKTGEWRYRLPDRDANFRQFYHQRLAASRKIQKK